MVIPPIFTNDSVDWCGLVPAYCGVNQALADLGAFGGETVAQWVGRASRDFTGGLG